ncbi:subtilisin-like protein [Multifurca ochricompacta]|uniref:tripeptidyl-peptidase II n=1 Tax=Multifurca ochricompacta TaxID=376703 RepID=A0AAD4QPZ4_9AGAM|nr:subtilisin-like protein [Multifurca ochricompacta]
MLNYHWLSVLSVIAVVPFGSLATPLAPRWDDMRVKHNWNTVPQNWECQGHPPDGTTLDLRIALKPHREDALIDALYEVSNPKHPSAYGAHLSKEQVAELVAPHPDSFALVNSWLEHHNQANALLGASYQLYRHSETNTTALRTLGYALPVSLHQHVQTVAPTTYFGSPNAQRQTSRVRLGAPTLPFGDHAFQAELAKAPTSGEAAKVPSSCASTITPSCLRALYNTSSYTPAAPAGTNLLGIAGYLEQYASQADLTTFLKKFRSDAARATFQVVQVNGGGNDQSNPGGEANLDIQFAEGISYPTPNIYYSTGGSPPYTPDVNTNSNTNEPYLDWLNFILNQTTIPQVISTSYGDDEQTVPRDYALSVCNLFAKLGARGVSLLFSSGDFGVGGGSCQTNDGTAKEQFLPTFPASCPWVTTVGGTTSVNPEVAASLSTGGFSNYFARPDYQDSTVSHYLSNLGSQYSGLYNASGRGFPDISAQAQNFQVIVGGSVQPTDGTSCSSPTAAAVISLLNDYLISHGKSPLGFLNPWLYSKGVAGLNDITSGSNPGCGTNGFSAVTGWDPVTGLGTPDFGKLQALV